MLIVLATGSPASAAGSQTAFRVKALCETHRPRTDECLGLRLLPTSLTSADVQANAQREVNELAAGVRPAVTYTSPWPGFLTPQLLHAAYSLPSQTSLSGSQTVAVVDAYNDPTVEADLGVFDKQFGLPECTTANGCFRRVNQEGNESPLPATEGGWAVEITLDVQMAHAICQNCRVLLVEANEPTSEDLGAAVETAVKAGATEISNSYGSVGDEAEEAALEREDNEKYYAHPGVVVTASTGDCGYRNQNFEDRFECEGLPSAVEFPASSPDVVAVGGTSLTETEGVWSSTVWENSGGGCSSVFNAPLWQSGVTNWSLTGCGTGRLSADVSAIGNPFTGPNVYDSTPEEKGAPTGWLPVGGTSVASPIVASEFALAGGSRGAEYPARTLYSYIGENNALYDVLAGRNGSCEGASSCQAVAGYDGPSGVGSPIGLAAFSPSAGSPVNTSAPTISGTAEKGQRLTEVPGKWTGSPTSAGYQWEDCNSSGSGCVPITGATEQTYTLTTSDEGSTIRVVETVDNGLGFAPPAVAAQTAIVPVPSGHPPTVTKLSPKKGPAEGPVIITGTNFSGVSAVDFGSGRARFYVNSESSITAEPPLGGGTVNVTVTTPNGTSAITKHDRFKYKRARR